MTNRRCSLMKGLRGEGGGGVVSRQTTRPPGRTTRTCSWKALKGSWTFRSRYPEVKIVAITGAVNHETILNSAHEFGADITVKKPFDIDDFGDKIEALVKT